MDRRKMMQLTVLWGGVLATVPVSASDRIAKDAGTGVAMEGYDTTAYFLVAKAMIGNDAHIVDWNGAKWQFATAVEAKLFAAAPGSYAPQFGAFCTRAMSFGKLVPADPEVWRIQERKLYLFAQPVGGRYFDKGPQAMIDKAAAFWNTLD